MKYFIAIAILIVFCINAKAQTTAGGDDKASSATIGKYVGYPYGVTYTIVKGKTVDCCADIIDCHMETKVTADKEIKPAEFNSNRYSYEVTYTVSSSELVKSEKK